MNIFCLNLISDYGLKTVIIAVVSSIITLLIKLPLKNRKIVFINYLPIILCMIIEIVYDSAFLYHSFTVEKDVLTSGLIAGTLSTAITAFIGRILSGKKTDFNKDILFIIGLLDDSVLEEDKEKIAVIILDIFNQNKDTLSCEELAIKVKTEIKEQLNVEMENQNVLLILSKILKASNL